MVDLVIADGVITKNEKDTVRRLIAEKLKAKGLKGFSFTALHQYKQFYQIYPDFIHTVSELFTNMDSSIVQTLSEQSQSEENMIWGTVSAIFESMPHHLNENTSILNESDLSFPPEILLSRLSFSHFIELINADTPLKRAFYEVQSIKNNWSVRELNRAMSTLLFERTWLSTNKETVMNVYLNYFRKNEMTDGDNPPVGIILCAGKDDALVEYATTGLPQEVFVSKYLVQLPSVEELKMLIANDRNKFNESQLP